VETVLGQSESDRELFVTCDGASAATARAAEAFATANPPHHRLHFEKGERLGE
jgi:hypothetical protein